MKLILLAEDSSDDIFVFERMLRKSGMAAQLRSMPDGQGVIDYLGRQGPYADPSMNPWPDLLLLDLKMPNVDGFAVLEWMSRNVLERPLTVAVLSGAGQPADRDRALGLGADAFLIKPATPAQIEHLLERPPTPWPAARDLPNEERLR